MKDRFKDFAQMKLSSQKDQNVAKNEDIEEIQLLRNQLGRKGTTLAQQEIEILSLKSKIQELINSENKRKEMIKDSENEAVIKGCLKQQKEFQRTLNKQLQEIDEKNMMISDLKSTNDVLELRVNRLKQAAWGMVSNDKIDQTLETQVQLRRQLTTAKQENQILEENLIQTKLKWADAEHEREWVKLELVNMSEELFDLTQQLDQYQ